MCYRVEGTHCLHDQGTKYILSMQVYVLMCMEWDFGLK